MSSLLKTNFKVLNAKNFIKSIGRTNPTPEYVYVFFGKDTEWDNELSPDSPINTVNYEINEIRSNIIGIKKITESDIAFIVPRYNWTTGTVYDVYSDQDTLLIEKEFYVINSANNVYKCLNNDNESPSTIQPTGTSTSPVNTGDGYTWKFMYNISSTMASNFLTNDYIPVPFEGQRSSLQVSVQENAVYQSGEPAGGHGSNPLDELFAKQIMVNVSLEQDESGNFPVDSDFRQYGLWLNPTIFTNDLLADENVYSVNDSNSPINPNSGSILFVNNITAIQRSSEQTETIKIIIDF